MASRWRREPAEGGGGGSGSRWPEELRLKSPLRRSSRRRRKGSSVAEAPSIPGQEGGEAVGETPASPRASRETCSFKTPKRNQASRSRLPTFSSPANEADTQQEIFWDPQSPISHKLGNGQKKQTVNGHTVEISEIVNRIAPQEEKPTCHEGNLLGVWIGDDAIPCTPSIKKVRSRTKENAVRGRQLKHREEELMKLAKQFDKNLTDAIQDQDAPCHNITHTTSEAEKPIEWEDETGVKNQHQFFEEHPNATFPVGAVDRSIKALEPCEDSRQEPLDLDAEKALNELFDCSTQKCSGRLSQPDSSSNSSSHENQSVLPGEVLVLDNTTGASKCVIGQARLTEESAAPVIKCMSSVPTAKAKGTFEQTAQKVGSCKTGSDVSSKVDGVVSDDFDDWGDDSFIMQITQNPELISTPEDALPHPSNKNGEGKEKTVVSLQGAPFHSFNRDSTLCALQEQNTGSGTTMRMVPHNFTTESKKAKSISTSGHNKFPCNNPIPMKPENKSKSEGFTQIKCPASSGFLEKRPVSVSAFSNLPKPQMGKYGSSISSIGHESSFVSFGKKPLDIRKTTSLDSVNHLKQRELPKNSVLSFENWNEPKFSDEVLDLFCESDSLWDTNDDDDLLYQVCDNVEKNTLSPEVVKDNVNELGSISPLEVGPCLRVAPQGISNCLQTQKGRMGRKTFSLETPATIETLLKSEKSTDPVQHNGQPFKTESVNCTPGKLYRSHSVPGGDFGSRSGSASLLSGCPDASNVQWQKGLCKMGQVQNNKSINQLPTEKSQYVFRKTNHSQALVLDCKSVNVGSSSGNILGLEESKNTANIPFQPSVQTNMKPPFKRHLSDQFVQHGTEQKSTKCSQEEIARKKQEALQRRKYKMQALLKNSAPT